MASARHPGRLSASPAIPLTLALMCCQLLAMGLVAGHNRDFAHLITDLRNEGYTVIPGPGALARMATPGVSFAAGLFFTATLGPMLAAWGMVIGEGVSRRPRWWVALPAVVLLSVPALVVTRVGMSWWAVALVAAVPMVGAAARLLQSVRHAPAPGWIPAPAGLALALAVLIGLGATWGAHLPYRIRDLVLHTRAGATLVQAYYRYALYPAQVLKSPQQRLVNAYTFTGDTDSVRAAWVRQRLRRFAYLPVAKPVSLALRVDLGKDGSVVLRDPGGHRLRIGYSAFMRDTDAVLSAFSRQTDSYARLRLMARWGLLYGLPLVVFGAMWWVLGWVSRGGGRWWLRGCVVVGGVAMASGLLAAVSPPGADRVLADYRLALQLGDQPPLAARPRLLSLAHDPNLLVAGTAAAGLGQHVDAASRRDALSVIAGSTNWYVQWKAYDGLLRGGWHP